MTTLYEGMFLLDNQTVREDFKAAKRAVTDTLTKHAAEVISARRWDERRLTYPIKHRRRATYVLTYFKAPPAAGPLLRRDFELDERVLRYLIVHADAVPEGELQLAAAEESADFVVPVPPGDDDPTPKEEEKAEASDSEDSDSDGDDDGDDDDDGVKPSRKRAARNEEDEGEDD